MKKYKFMTIIQINKEIFNEKPVYRIFNSRLKEQIGVISFYKPWKQYVFSSQPDCVFNNSCLKDIINFIEKEIK